MCAKKASVKKPAKPKVKKPSKTELLEEKAKLYDRIRVKEKERRRLLSRFDELTKERKAAKEALGFCETEICGLGHAMDEKHPLFDQTAESSALVESKPTGKDSWRSVVVAELKVGDRVLKALEDAGFSTLGKLSDHMRDQASFWAKEIKGLGEKGAEEVCDRFADFWKEHPEDFWKEHPEYGENKDSEAA